MDEVKEATADLYRKYEYEADTQEDMLNLTAEQEDTLLEEARERHFESKL